MRIITIDFETFWDSKNYTLSKMGPIKYIRDPRFHAQIMGYRINRGPVEVTDDIPKALAMLDLSDPNTITVAHNGNGFDFLILSEIFGVVPSHTLDTIDMMRWTGLSSVMAESHATLTAHFKTGMKMQGTVISDGKYWPADFTSEEQAAFRLYCAQDVEQCSENCFAMLPHITPDMLAFDTITSHMATEPKLWADVPALQAYDAKLTEQTDQARQGIMHLFHFASVDEFQTNIRSADKFCVMLRQLGVEPPMKYSEKKSETKKTKMEAQGLDTSDPESYAVYTPALSKQDREFVEMQEHEDPRVSLLVRTRLENNSSIQQSRVRTFIRMGEYHRPVPVMLKAFGAHTGRYAAGNTEGKSDSLNWQNLSKRNPAMLPLRQAIKVADGYKLVSCDSSQIEARCLAYVANQTDMLEAFRQRADVYANFGEIISGGIPAKEIHDGAKGGDKKLKALRNISKTIILGCLGADTKVLTDNGWKKITQVTLEDKVWDGESWVEHEGVIFKGTKHIIRVEDTLICTPDHLIWNGTSWMEANTFPHTEIEHEYEAVFDILNAGLRHCFTVGREGHRLLVHNCGYGTSPAKASHTMWMQGQKQDKDYERHSELVKSYVLMYRQANSAIVYFWKVCQQVIEALAGGGAGTFGGPNNDLFHYETCMMPGCAEAVPSIILPSGFALRYPNLHAEVGESGKVEYQYTLRRGRSDMTHRLYGSALTENLVQSLAFQLLMWQACRMAENKIRLVCNIHDSFSTVVEERAAEDTARDMIDIMRELPPWLPGCPVDAEAEITSDFTGA